MTITLTVVYGVRVGDITDDTTDGGADRRGNGGDEGGGHSTK